MIMRIATAGAVLILLAGGLSAKPPPITTLEHAVEVTRLSKRDAIDSCSAQATKGGVYGFAVLHFSAPRDATKATLSVDYSENVSGELRSCVSNVAEEMRDLLIFDRASDPQYKDLPIVLGSAIPILDPPASILPVWKQVLSKKENAEQLTKLLSPVVKLDKSLCLRASTFLDGGVIAWVRQVGPTVAALWVGRSAATQALNSLLDTHGILMAAWVDTDWMLMLDRRIASDGEYGRDKGLRLCLIRLDDSKKQKLLSATDDVGACWRGSLKERLTNPSVQFPNDHYRSVSVTQQRACALGTDGVVLCCGAHDASAPTAKYVDVRTADDHTCAVRLDGQVACWGDNALGQATPPSGEFSRVDVTVGRSCGLRKDGTLTCWGKGSDAITPSRSKYVGLSVGSESTCALDKKGNATCWGTSNSKLPQGKYSQVVANWELCGLLSNGVTNCGKDPPTSKFASVSNSAELTCGLAVRSSNLSCWPNICPERGADKLCQTSFPSGRFEQISGSSGTWMCGVRHEGTIECWGTPWPGKLAVSEL